MYICKCLLNTLWNKELSAQHTEPLFINIVMVVKSACAACPLEYVYIYNNLYTIKTFVQNNKSNKQSTMQWMYVKV